MELTEGQRAWHDEAHRQGLWVVTELSEYIRELSEIGLHYGLGQIRRDAIRFKPSDTPLDAVWLVHGDFRMAIIINPTSRLVRAVVTTPAGRVEKEFAAFEVHIVR